MSTATMPTLYVPHGGGPCFYMDWKMGSPHTWDRLADWFRELRSTLPSEPTALLVVSAHWEEEVPTTTAVERPTLRYEYHGFPEHTYRIQWPVPGSPALAEQVRTRLVQAGIEAATDASRGIDHAVFVPFKLTWPQADIPTVSLSLSSSLDAAEHIAIGRALVGLRDEGVLIAGSGMSYHNMKQFMRGESLEPSQRFDGWLAETIALPDPERAEQLERWAQAPHASDAHPRPEHLLPLMVAAGAAGGDPGQVVFRDEIMRSVISAVRFG